MIRKNKNKKRQKFSSDRLTTNFAKAAYLTVLFISIAAIVLCLTHAEGGSVAGLEEGWVDEAGNELSLSGFNTYDAGTDTFSALCAYYTFDGSGMDNALMFRARNCYVNIYVDGRLMSEDFSTFTRFYGSSPGSRWHCFSLPPSDEAFTVCLEAMPCYEASNAYIDNLYLGNPSDIYRKIVSGKMFGFLMSIFFQFCGCIILFIWFYVGKTYNSEKDVLYLGLATYFSAQWLGAESMLWQLLVGHSETVHFISYLSLAAIPLSYGMLAYHRLKGKLRLFSQFYCIISSAALIVLLALHLFGIREFHDSLTVIHVLLVPLVPLMVPLVLSYRNMQHKKKNDYFLFPLLAALVVCIAASIVKYRTNANSNYSGYVRVALLCFLLCLIIYQFRYVMATYANGMKANMLEGLAMTDYMTGLYNRTAFNSHMAEYNHLIDSFSPLGIIQFDVNNLKTVNDTLGHEKGDMMIKAVADGLKKAFDPYGSVVNSYRMGGDEFLTIINSLNADDIYKECIENLWSYCDEFNKQPDLGFTLKIAHGYVCLKGGKALSEAIDEADVLMYENKRRLKGLK